MVPLDLNLQIRPLWGVGRTAAIGGEGHCADMTDIIEINRMEQGILW
jgi:hypothetical protein